MTCDGIVVGGSPDPPRPHGLGPDDAGELLTLQRSAYAEQAQLHRDPWLPPLVQSLRELRTELEDPDVVALGLRDGHRLVAAVRLRHRSGEEVAELGRLIVAPDRQGQGLGTRLLLAAEAELVLRAPEVGSIRLFTGEYSAANLTLYTRHGYRETHRSDADTGVRGTPPYRLVHLVKNVSR